MNRLCRVSGLCWRGARAAVFVAVLVLSGLAVNTLQLLAFAALRPVSYRAFRAANAALSTLWWPLLAVLLEPLAGVEMVRVKRRSPGPLSLLPARILRRTLIPPPAHFYIFLIERAHACVCLVAALAVVVGVTRGYNVNTCLPQ